MYIHPVKKLCTDDSDINYTEGFNQAKYSNRLEITPLTLRAMEKSCYLTTFSMTRKNFNFLPLD